MPHLTKMRVGGKENEADQRASQAPLTWATEPCKTLPKSPPKLLNPAALARQGDGTDHGISSVKRDPQGSSSPDVPRCQTSQRTTISTSLFSKHGHLLGCPRTNSAQALQAGSWDNSTKTHLVRPPLGGISQMSLNFATCRPALAGGNHPQTCFDR